MNQGLQKTIITHNFEETQKVGFDFAQTLKGGDVLALHGDLGSGKTTFVQGLAKGLGIEKKIISPTFIIMRSYVIPDLIRNPENNELDSRLRGNDNVMKNFYHVDLYRIEDEKDVEGLGLLEIMNSKESVVVIEWPEKIESLLPEKRIDLVFKYIDEDIREIMMQ